MSFVHCVHVIHFATLNVIRFAVIQLYNPFLTIVWQSYDPVK